MQSSSEFTPEQRRRNVRAAWILGALVLLIALTSIPFWQGMFRIAMNQG